MDRLSSLSLSFRVRTSRSCVVTVGSQVRIPPPIIFLLIIIYVRPGSVQVGSKIQRIVINKQGAGLAAAGQPILRTAGGQQIIVLTTTGGVRTVQHINSQAGT